MKTLFLFSIITVVTLLFLAPQKTLARSSPFRKTIALELDTLCNRPQRASFPAGAVPGQYVYPLTQRDINYIKDLGASLVIIQGGPALWANVAKTDPYANNQNPANWNNTNYNWEPLDRALGLLQLNNIEPIIQSFGTPSWANGIYTDSSLDSDNCFDLLDNGPILPTAHSGLTEYANFMQAVATRYDGTHAPNPYRLGGFIRVNRYILWNEPNYQDFWTEIRNGFRVQDVAQDSSLINKFVTLNNQAYNMIKDVNASSIIYGGAICGHCEGFTWLKSAYNAGLKLDAIAAHPYPIDYNVSPSNQTPTSTQLSTNNIQALKNLVDSLPNWANKPIFMSESGYRTHEGKLFPNAQANEGPWLSEIFSISKAVPTNYGWTQFLLYPESNWGTGLVSDTGSEASDIRYPSYSVFKSTAEIYPMDMNNDKIINYKDNVLFINEIGQSNSLLKDQADLNSDGKINSLDFALSTKNRNADFPLTVSLPAKVPLPIRYDEVTIYPDGKQILIYGSNMWERPNLSTTFWSSGPLETIFLGQNAPVRLPNTHIDSYSVIPDGENAGSITVTSDNRRWYRNKHELTWTTSTLSELWTGHTSNYPLPINVIESNTIIPAGLPTAGGQLITSGNRYWWRNSQTSTSWTSGTLAELFTGHSSSTPLPTTKIDAVITFPSNSPYPGWQFVYSSDRYWYRTNLNSTSWTTNTITNSLSGHQVY